MTSETYEAERAQHELKRLREMNAKSGRLGSGVSLTDYIEQERNAAVWALAALAQYVGGSDAPKGHPCNMAYETLRLLLPEHFKG